MNKIVLFGAGKSATVLIDYLLEQAETHQWKLIVVDNNLALAEQKIKGSPFGEALSADVKNEAERAKLISEASIVLSMLPPFLHALVADDCIRFSKNLLTASYVDDHLQQKKEAIRQSGALFLCEIGLDPGIDHMSAMQLIDRIHAQQGKIVSFKSHCGGLVAPESDNNPWHYKISWNPRNIILAGKAGAVYREAGNTITQQYAQLFHQQEQIEVEGLGAFGWYANRDSLSYLQLYGLTDTTTFIRTTLRHPDFMQGWKYIVDLQLTNETIQYSTAGASVASIYREHLNRHQNNMVIPDAVQAQLDYLFTENDEIVFPAETISPADLLQLVAEKQLALQPADRDMIVMQHELEYVIGNNQRQITSTLVVKGENSLYTAMAKTVGLPLGIAAKLILTGQITLKGLHIPTHAAIYTPVLKELEERGIRFTETEKEISA